MNDSDKLMEQCSDYIDGNLSPEACREFEQYLMNTPETQETIYRMQMIRDSLNNLPQVQTSPDFEIRLHEKIRTMGSVKSFRYSSRYFADWKVPAVGFAVVFVLVSFFVFYPQSSGDVNITAPRESGFSPNFSGQERVLMAPKTVDAAAASVKHPAVVDDSTQRQKNKDQLKKNIKLVNESSSGN